MANEMWGVHAGRSGDANSRFLQTNCIALGWHAAGDLGSLSANREAFKNRIIETFPNMKQGAVPVNAGQLYRFVHEAKIGDFVVYPSKNDRRVYIGKIEGNYEYVPSTENFYPHRRRVQWLNEFSQGALHELGAAMTFFAVKTYAEEFVAAVQGKVVSPPVEQDESVVVVSQEIEEQTRDYILKKLAQEFKGVPFEDFVAHLLQRMGYKTRQPKRGKGADGGIDIIAHKDELGFEPPIIKVQVKSTEGTSGDPKCPHCMENVLRTNTRCS